ncbi:hypothetical protein F5X68DRAFT_60079 [Plectosphaerella plurivora]|uniref:Uncharacterized protein n=1 Tax=Plectosphaerella plurivora TaxID=936078 RepID=A0A9P8VIA7_9PEZI|nr:hypothetical protein F5X68DRAFT_60079 [Plectosphaerella plurivora]
MPTVDLDDGRKWREIVKSSREREERMREVRATRRCAQKMRRENRRFPEKDRLEDEKRRAAVVVDGALSAFLSYPFSLATGPGEGVPTRAPQSPPPSGPRGVKNRDAACRQERRAIVSDEETRFPTRVVMAPRILGGGCWWLKWVRRRQSEVREKSCLWPGALALGGRRRLRSLEADASLYLETGWVCRSGQQGVPNRFTEASLCQRQPEAQAETNG